MRFFPNWRIADRRAGSGAESREEPSRRIAQDRGRKKTEVIPLGAFPEIAVILDRLGLLPASAALGQMRGTCVKHRNKQPRMLFADMTWHDQARGIGGMDEASLHHPEFSCLSHFGCKPEYFYRRP
jgi:hypothetical protein